MDHHDSLLDRVVRSRRRILTRVILNA